MDNSIKNKIETEKENTEAETAQEIKTEAGEIILTADDKTKDEEKGRRIADAVKEAEKLTLESNKDIFSEYKKNRNEDALKRTVKKHLHQTYCSLLLSKDRIKVLEASKNMLYKAYTEKEKKRSKLDIFDSALDEMWSAYTEYLVAEQALKVERKICSMAGSDCLTIKQIYAKLFG